MGEDLHRELNAESTDTNSSRGGIKNCSDADF